MTITALPVLNRTDATFRADVDTFFGTELPQFSVEAEAARVEINANTATAGAAAVSAANQVTLAANQVTLAAIQAQAAAGSALVAGAVVWVSGTTYAVGDARYSSINLQTYRSATVHTSTVDPSLDDVNWVQVSPAMVDQVQQPLNLSPDNATVDVKETPVLTSGTFYSLYGTPLSKSRFQISTVSNFASVLHDSGEITGSLTYIVPAGILQQGALTYYWRVQHSTQVNSVEYWSEYSAGTYFVTKVLFFDTNVQADGLSQLTTIQSLYNPATTYALNANVYVRINDLNFIEYKSLQNSNTGNTPSTSPAFWELIFNNNTSTAGYFGEVLASQLSIDRGEWLSTTAYVTGDMVVLKTGAGFTQSDLTAYVALTSSTNRPPATNPSAWQQRTALPTGSSLVDALGIWNITPAVKINNDSGWLKFVHKGEVKYIAKKPFLHTVSWNDIAKADCVYGDRTIRIGSRLYRVSLLSGAEADPTTWTASSTATDNKGATSEWNELVYRVHTDVPTDGATTYHGGKQVGLNWKNFTDAEMVMTFGSGSGSYTLCKETQAAGTTTRVFRGGVSLSYFFTDVSSNADSNYGFRPCLTLISEPEASSELYGAEATGVGPSVASLQYDPITDTGFYGEVPSADLYTGSALSTAIGLTAGTLQFDTDPWLKFYWHGQVLFISKKPYRHTVSWENINTANAVYGVNLGSTGRTRLTKGANQFDVKLMKGATADPAAASSPGRQWNELMYRVHTEVPTGQIGSNWAGYTNTDTQITGNGGYCWMQEVYAPSSTSRVFRGSVSLSYFDAVASSAASSSTGFRPCLSLVKLLPLSS